MRALVIGGTGPTGPLVIKALRDRGYAVSMLNRGGRPLPAELADIELIRADPHFTESLVPALAGRRFDVVLAMYGRLRLMPEVLRECTDRVISVGGTAYADQGGRPATEDDSRAVENRIVARIVETEDVLDAAHHRGDFNLTHFRYPLLWGPRQLAPREWSIVRRVLDRRPFIPVANGGLTLESRCFVSNAAHAVTLGLDDPVTSSGRTYNVADMTNPPDYQRVADLCRALGAPDTGLLNLPAEATGPAGFWGVGRDLDFASEGRPPRTSHQLVDTSRIQRELGYVDAVTYEQAVELTARHYCEHPLESGGDVEEALSDPFDYGAEDRYAAELKTFIARTHRIAFAGVQFVHQYDHPKAPTP